MYPTMPHMGSFLSVSCGWIRGAVASGGPTACGASSYGFGPRAAPEPGGTAAGLLHGLREPRKQPRVSLRRREPRQTAGESPSEQILRGTAELRTTGNPPPELGEGGERLANRVGARGRSSRPASCTRKAPPSLAGE